MIESRYLKLAAAVFLLILLALPLGASAQDFDPNPPAEPVKLIFIHHSCGENWLADDHGNLGRTLGENNYFVSDTNYGWGPDSIGDRTDITNWPEWFTGPDSGRYLEALYTESGQNSWYTRNLPDPGGENQIVMFKSCYPNSNLEGNPNDLPSREDDWLSVGNAKAIYNELLGYFATRPDKLFIVITAPPVQDPTFAANARAFNTWLVTEWLRGYDEGNVTVFDFYNVLTGPDSHHRFQGSYIEHSWGVGGTLYYPDNGDDHPSPAGNRKAAEEFVPLLNVYYHQWQSGEPAEPPPPPPPPPPAGTEETPEPAEPEPPVAPPPMLGGMIDDFESEANVWEAYWDDTGSTSLTCGRDEAAFYSGSAGLRLEYDVAPEGWASCSLVYPAPQDWRAGAGLAVYLRAGRVGQEVVVIAFQGNSSDELGHFEFRAVTNQEAVDGWQRVDIAWEWMEQPPWEGDGTVRFDPGQAMGLAFLFDAPAGGRNSGYLWVDDVSFLSSAPPAGEQPPPAPPSAEESPPTAAPGAPDVSDPAVEETPAAEQIESEPEEEGGRPGICPGSMAIGLMAVAGVLWTRKRTT